jgi:hypothetical protein
LLSTAPPTFGGRLVCWLGRETFWQNVYRASAAGENTDFAEYPPSFGAETARESPIIERLSLAPPTVLNFDRCAIRCFLSAG